MPLGHLPNVAHRARRSISLLLTTQLVVTGMVAATLTATMLSTQAAHAQTASESQQRTRFDIPAGTLSSALNRFAQQTNLYLTGSGELTRNKTSEGLKGDYTVSEGLQQLLSGSVCHESM